MNETYGKVSSSSSRSSSSFLQKWGIQWCFAHNGEVPKFSNKHSNEFPLLGKTIVTFYHPVGDTDSEAVFCAILNALKAEFSKLPSMSVLQETLCRLCDEIITNHHNYDETIIFNFLLGCGPYTLFAYSWPGSRPGSKVWNGLWYIVREQPPVFQTAKLMDVDYSMDFQKVTTPSARVALITTKPLTNEKGWKEFKRGELLMFHKGCPYDYAATTTTTTPWEYCKAVERAGRESCLKCFECCAKLSTSPTGVNMCACVTEQQQ